MNHLETARKLMYAHWAPDGLLTEQCIHRLAGTLDAVERETLERAACFCDGFISGSGKDFAKEIRRMKTTIQVGEKDGKESQKEAGTQVHPEAVRGGVGPDEPGLRGPSQDSDSATQAAPAQAPALTSKDTCTCDEPQGEHLGWCPASNYDPAANTLRGCAHNLHPPKSCKSCYPSEVTQTVSAESEMRRALSCLRLEVSGGIVDDIEKVFNAYVKQTTPADTSLIEALKFYANEDYHGGCLCSGYLAGPDSPCRKCGATESAVESDYGKRARAALAVTRPDSLLLAVARAAADELDRLRGLHYTTNELRAAVDAWLRSIK